MIKTAEYSQRIKLPNSQFLLLEIVSKLSTFIKPITVILLVQPKLNNLNQKGKNDRLFILQEKDDNYPDNKMFKMVGLVETVPKHYPH